MKKFFDGDYYKHTNGSDVLCFVVGRTNDEEFIQVITRDKSYNIPYIKGNSFSYEGIKLDIHTDELDLTGEIKYSPLSPIKYDIMGPFKFFPMECRHRVISMYHALSGNVTLNGTKMNFDDGIGYIEGDSGTSFPSYYTWLHANDFKEKCSVMVSVANIPFAGLHFKGCICVVQYGGKEYRLATYLGVKVVCCNEKEIILKQGKYRLNIKLGEICGHPLAAPDLGEMSRTIIETPACPAEYSFYIKDKQIFKMDSNMTSFECEN